MLPIVITQNQCMIHVLQVLVCRLILDLFEILGDVELSVFLPVYLGKEFPYFGEHLHLSHQVFTYQTALFWHCQLLVLYTVLLLHQFFFFSTYFRIYICLRGKRLKLLIYLHFLIGKTELFYLRILFQDPFLIII